MKTKLLILAAIALIAVSCEKYGIFGSSLGGSQSPIGEVNNTFTFSNPNGVTNTSASVTDLTDGISTITYSVKITDTKLLTYAGDLTGANLTGNVLSGSVKAKITSDGIQTIHQDGKLILVKYTAKVGDTYTLKTSNTTITREVMSVSATDDFYWRGMMIKTIKIEETGYTNPGVSRIEYFANHRFGLVAAVVYFTDGTSRGIDVYSSGTN